jgi:hypothetical protein
MDIAGELETICTRHVNVLRRARNFRMGFKLRERFCSTAGLKSDEPVIRQPVSTRQTNEWFVVDQ